MSQDCAYWCGVSVQLRCCYFRDKSRPEAHELALFFLHPFPALWENHSYWDSAFTAASGIIIYPEIGERITHRMIYGCGVA